MKVETNIKAPYDVLRTLKTSHTSGVLKLRFCPYPSDNKRSQAIDTNTAVSLPDWSKLQYGWNELPA